MFSTDLVYSNLEFYDTIKPKNPDNSYTVIATLNDYDTGALLALATGTQANLRQYPDDIQDCHAESLVKRAYKRYLINRFRYILSESSSPKGKNSLIAQERQRSLILFVSQFPCGFIKRYEGDEPLDTKTGAPIKRKPGRGTYKGNKLIYVEKDNCSAKLSKWLVNGVQGQKLHQIFDIQSKIKQLFIGNCEPDQDFDYRSRLNQFKTYLGCERLIEFGLAEHVRRDEFVFNSTRKPMPISLVWWAKGTDPNTTMILQKDQEILGQNYELIVDGRKMGLIKKHIVSDNQSYRLRVADHCLKSDLTLIAESYKGFLERH